MYKKMESVIEQLMARKAKLFILCNEGDEDMKAWEAKGCKLIQVHCGGPMLVGCAHCVHLSNEGDEKMKAWEAKGCKLI